MLRNHQWNYLGFRSSDSVDMESVNEMLLPLPNRFTNARLFGPADLHSHVMVVQCTLPDLLSTRTIHASLAA